MAAENPDDLALAGTLPLKSLLLLWRAAHYADSAQCSPCEIPIEIESLRTTGLADCDLRWLAAKGYLDLKSAGRRGVRSPGASSLQLRFTRGARFVLTHSGRRLVKHLMGQTVGGHWEATREPVVLGRENGPVPLWDQQRRELRLGAALVKRFSVPAENQEIILSSFQEEAWPPRLDDPLPPAPGLDAKRRLHSTIQCLNRNQKAPLLRFHGDGLGSGIRWEHVLPAAG